MNIWWVSPFVILCKVCIHKCKCPLGTSLNSYEMRRGAKLIQVFWDKLLQQIGPAAWLPKGHLSTNWWLVLKLIVPLQTFCYQNAPGTTILHNVFTEWSAVNFYPSWVSKVHSPTSDTVFLSLLCLLQCRQRQKIWKMSVVLVFRSVKISALEVRIWNTAQQCHALAAFSVFSWLHPFCPTEQMPSAKGLKITAPPL